MVRQCLEISALALMYDVRADSQACLLRRHVHVTQREAVNNTGEYSLRESLRSTVVLEPKTAVSGARTPGVQNGRTSDFPVALGGTGCPIYGISAWGLRLDGAKQQNLIITQGDEPAITVGCGWETGEE
jgi:hypothetical protein